MQLKEGEGSAIVDLLKNPEKCSTIHDKLTDRDFFTVGGKRYRCDAHSRTNDMFIGYPQDSDNILFIQELYGKGDILSRTLVTEIHALGYTLYL